MSALELSQIILNIILSFTAAVLTVLMFLFLFAVMSIVRQVRMIEKALKQGYVEIQSALEKFLDSLWLLPFFGYRADDPILPVKSSA